jgi:hypothetical protein
LENDMEKQEILDRIVKVTAEVLGIEAEMVKPESNFVYDLGAESTQSVQLERPSPSRPSARPRTSSRST